MASIITDKVMKGFAKRAKSRLNQSKLKEGVLEYYGVSEIIGHSNNNEQDACYHVISKEH